MIRLTVALALWSWLSLGAALAQEGTAPLAPSSNDLHEFTRLLSDPRIQGWIAQQAADAPPPEPAAAPTLREELQAVLDDTRARMAALGAAWRARDAVGRPLTARLQRELAPGAHLRALTFVVIFLFIGAGLEWLYRQYTDPMRLRIELAHVETARQRITAALLRVAIALAALVIFACGSIGAFAAFTWPPVLEAVVIDLLVAVLVVRAIRALLVLFLAPQVPTLRLVPLENDTAKQMIRLLLGVAAVLVTTAALATIYSRLAGGGSAAPQALAVTIALAGVALLLTVAAIVAGFRHAQRRQLAPLSRAQRFWRLYLTVLAALVFAALVMDRTALMWSLALLGLLVPVLHLLRLWVDAAFEQARSEMTPLLPMNNDDTTPAADAALEAPDLRPASETYRPIVHRLVRFIALIAVGAALALIWDLRLFERAAATTFSGHVIGILVDSAVALLIADLIWVWASTAIDRRLAAYRPPEPGTAPGPEARMATLLPLLRVVLMVTLLAMVSMSVLSSLGVNIAPILAGAGVVGIAIGFGAQSLVKDVVSGIFFLVDDAFRVGEYVEIDQLRGTVEKISIRSLQIRHHRGAVHTLPFGELRHLTNHSRDWVIMKLEFRVPFDTDLQLVKKIIKRIGVQLKENEFYGDSILDTLKSQGVRRMEEFNMVVGVKFMTRPGEQWLVRRDAYQMVRDAFEANGIRMAERNVKVEVAGNEYMTPQEREAVAAAAQQAVEGPKGPAAPIPDEP